MDSRSAPLVQRKAHDPIAYLCQPLAAVQGQSGEVSVEQFLQHVHALAEQLPAHAHIINLCGNRYLFLLSICAAVLREQINLLPPNKNPATQSTLAKRYDDVYVLHDGVAIAEELADLDISQLNLTGSTQTEFNVPDIALEQLALISFTSGSTGDSKPNLKTWETLTVSTAINQRYMLPDSVVSDVANSPSDGPNRDPDKNTDAAQIAGKDATQYLLATVPGQHMWGLETSVLMSLFAPVCVVDTRPLFPQDIALQLQKLPAPRVLVSTPVHLRALVESELEYPDVATILCATSPLPQDLAVKTERGFSGCVREVYGCSEVGSMAVRQTAHESIWQLFAGINFSLVDGKVSASAAHIADAIVLQDNLEFVESDRFRLLGRETDMVDIAGKRGSLSEINQLLLGFHGLLDGVVIFPEQRRPVPRLVAIVVLKEGIDPQALRDYFRQHLDAAFVPRPIFVVERLPREESGKLPAKRVLALYKNLSIKT